MSKLIKKLTDDYCVLDLETTGLSSEYHEIIEIGCLKVRNRKITEKYSQLIKPVYPVSQFITDLTGIRNSMLFDKPNIKDVKKEFLDFIGDDIIVGHNTSFDIGFINKKFNVNIKFYTDTLSFCRKLYPYAPNHKLSTISELLGLSQNTHRSIDDCITTYELYEKIKNTIQYK